MSFFLGQFASPITYAALGLSLLSSKQADAQAAKAPTVITALELPNAQTNGVALAPDARLFLVIAKQKGQDVPQIAEYVGGTRAGGVYKGGQLKPYPDASWNAWEPGADASTMFVHANSIRFGPDGTLWVVDFGSEGLGEPDVKHGPKLVGMNIATGQVVETLYLDNVTKSTSAVDDVRFNGDHAYLTDAGWPGIIVVHLPDGHAYRTLNDTDSVKALHPLRGEGHQLQDKHGKPIYFHADQLEVSPDGKLLYYQTNAGPMSVIDTAALDNEHMPDAERVKHVRPFANTGTSGGTAIDKDGNIYVAQADNNSVLKITPAGKITTLVQGPQYVWVDAMWISADGRLWMPAAQMDRTPSFNNGKMNVTYPMQVFTVKVGDGPPANDHR